MAIFGLEVMEVRFIFIAETLLEIIQKRMGYLTIKSNSIIDITIEDIGLTT
ncbi:MAG: hypothetical protein V3V14_11475 [Saprospiraceae bacterium]